MKKTLATDSPVYCINIEDSDKPMTAANAQNKTWTVLSFIFAIPIFKAIMNPKGASIIIKASGEP